MYVRFEDLHGRGIFTMFEFIEYPFKRLPRPPRRSDAVQLDALIRKLGRDTPAPPYGAYRDQHCRRPITWYRPEAVDLIALADEIAGILRSRGEPVLKRVAAIPGDVIWQDDVQVVVRAPRSQWRIVPDVSRKRREAYNGDRSTIRRWSRRAARRCGPARALSYEEIWAMAGNCAWIHYELTSGRSEPMNSDPS